MESVCAQSERIPIPPGELVFRQLEAEPGLPAEVAAIVRAALAAAAPAGDPPRPADGTTFDFSGMFLRAIRVAGFRGVGPETVLELPPGPGLTLVTGRNGSGKSSFAEAAELALTGANRRWDGRSAAWREGWRNLHHRGPVRIDLELRTDGPETELTISRAWPEGEPLTGGEWVQRPAGASGTAFPAGRWAPAMELYRPFLSYSELGALVDGKPSDLFDALHQLLGLDELIAAQEHIRSVRLEMESAARTARRERQLLLAELPGIPDRRAARAERILRRPEPDFAALETLLSETTGGPEPAALRAVLGLELPPAARIDQLLARLRAARTAVAAATSPASAADLRILDLLRIAYSHVAEQETGGDPAYRRSDEDAGGSGAGAATVRPQDPGGSPISGVSGPETAPGSVASGSGCPCPVCGRGSLDGRWLSETAAAVDELSERTAGLVRARTELSDVLAELRAVIGDVPTEPTTAEPAYLDTAALGETWAQWRRLTELRDPDPDVLGAAHERLSAELGFLRQRAAKELDRLEQAWTPLVPRLRNWLELARTVHARAAELQTARAAEVWLKSATAQVRDERLAPLAGTARWVWQSLRQQSNVELGGIRLQGNANSARRVQLDVTVDEVDGAALGVMSQGELHALGLALFLPRATLADSPFRFVVIDDPVQAMDPAKVDGLARVLATVAWDRQVVVFTHDDRLAEAVRRMQIDARILEVQRRERSVVEIRLSSDPVHRYLDDARALLRTPQLPPAISDELVASCCRSALEAAGLARAKRMLLAEGMDHREVQRRIDTAQSTRAMVTLAVLGPGRRIEDLNKRLAKEGRWAVEVVRDATAGAHIPIARDLSELIADTERFVNWLAR
ncbi:AAA family ATPase [Nocardia carnea]|uniref:Nuclease SbcCD subunit C n=1 Tax=Nocardia carnea TaxID=37328 RepID=A0ABW7TQQ1_9NOCA|nr:AAA family ATPase [Nocardia carnea]